MAGSQQVSDPRSSTLVHALAAGRAILLLGQRNSPGLLDGLTLDVAATTGQKTAVDLMTLLASADDDRFAQSHGGWAIDGQRANAQSSPHYLSIKKVPYPRALFIGTPARTRTGAHGLGNGGAAFLPVRPRVAPMRISLLFHHFSQILVRLVLARACCVR